MTRAAAIRTWLGQQATPQTSDAIATALGFPAHCWGADGQQTDRMRLHWTIGEMHRKGLLVRTGTRSTGYRYALGRPVTARLSAEELKRRRNARERARERARRDTPEKREAYNAQRREWATKRRAQDAACDRARAVVAKMKADAIAAATQRAEAKAEAKRAEQAAKAAARAAAKAAPKPAPAKRPSPGISIPPKPPCPTAPPPKVEGFETVDEWMARTGKAPEKLPPGLTSTPLRALPISKQDRAA